MLDLKRGTWSFPCVYLAGCSCKRRARAALISRVSDVSEFKLPAINTEKRLHNEDGWLSARGDGKALNIRLWLGALLSHCPALTLPYPCRALHGRVIGRSYKFAAVRALT